MEFQEAKALSIAVRRASGLLDGAASEAKKSFSQEDFMKFRREIGSILGEIYDLVLEEIWDEFPELLPEGMEES